MNELINLFTNYYSGVYKLKQKHIVIRCPYCGDSIKNPNHVHLYISLELPVFYCVRCSTGGTLYSLLLKIKERFKYIDVIAIAKTFLKRELSYQKQLVTTHSEIYSKLLNKTEPQIIEAWLYKENLYIPNYHILPINTYNAIKTFVEQQNLPNGIVYITLGCKLIYRPFFKNEKFRFRTLQLKNCDNTKFNLRLSVFTTFVHKVKKINVAKRKLYPLIVAESLTDLISFYKINQIDGIYISTNGKYTSQVLPFLELSDEIYYLVDSDAARQEILFALKHAEINKKITLVLPDNVDFRSSLNPRYVTVGA